MYLRMNASLSSAHENYENHWLTSFQTGPTNFWMSATIEDELQDNPEEIFFSAHSGSCELYSISKYSSLMMYNSENFNIINFQQSISYS